MRVLIAGAGPAGTSCAIMLRKSGFDVLILEQMSFPRFRPGECVHPGIEPLLKQLEVWEDVLAMDPIRHQFIHINNNGNKYDAYYHKANNWEGFQLPREDFDHLLLKKAIRLGCKFIEHATVEEIIHSEGHVRQVRTTHGNHIVDFLVDATGAKGALCRLLNIGSTLKSRTLISTYSRIRTSSKIPSYLNAYFEIKQAYWGYCALIKPGTYSLTYSSREQHKENAALFLKQHFGTAYDLEFSKGYETSWKIIEKYDFENFYAVGDALMTFDPSSSKGILKALMTSIYCAHAITGVHQKSSDHQKAIESYRQWSEHFLLQEISVLRLLLPVEMSNEIFILPTE